MRHSRGFTLIELMIVVAIIAVLASIGMVAYQDNIRTAQSSKVSAHYRVASYYVKWQFANARTRVSQGLAPDPPIPDTSSGWVTLINWESSEAPGGGPAYITGAGSALTGAIGVSVTGTWANRDTMVTVTRPAFSRD